MRTVSAVPLGSIAVASAPAAFRVRVWQIMSGVAGHLRGARRRSVLRVDYPLTAAEAE